MCGLFFSNNREVYKKRKQFLQKIKSWIPINNKKYIWQKWKIFLPRDFIFDLLRFQFFFPRKINLFLLFRFFHSFPFLYRNFYDIFLKFIYSLILNVLYVCESTIFQFCIKVISSFIKHNGYYWVLLFTYSCILVYWCTYMIEIFPRD